MHTLKRREGSVKPLELVVVGVTITDRARSSVVPLLRENNRFESIEIEVNFPGNGREKSVYTVDKAKARVSIISCLERILTDFHPPLPFHKKYITAYGGRRRDQE